MANWPTAAEVEAITDAPQNADDAVRVAGVLAAAIGVVGQRCCLEENPDAPDPPTVIPAAVKEATILLAHRWLNRDDTPFGILGHAEAATYLPRVDVDVEAMLAPYLDWSVG